MKQKQWVQIAAVFFGLMIVLTICSRAASSAVKARVTVTRASRQKISHEISLNGSVEAKNYVLQYVTSGLMVTGVQVSPGQQVEAGDVIFTVDMQKLQESIASIETELNRVDEKERLSVSRAEAAYQDVKANAEEEKARAYQTYEKAVAEYQNYINTHKKTAGVSAESTEERTMNEKAASVYDETVAKELENAVESEKSAYAAVVREQEKQISAAADAVQRTKEDLNLSQDTDTLEEQLKNLRACAENGILCALVRMPGNLAVLDANAAYGLQQEHPEVTTWYIAGHSLGGAMAAGYAAAHDEDYDGLILLAAYSTKDLTGTALRVLSVYGSEDGVMNQESYEKNRANLPADTTEVVLDGGCHAQFGSYGPQNGDGIPTISGEEQVRQTAEAIAAFVGQ